MEAKFELYPYEGCINEEHEATEEIAIEKGDIEDPFPFDLTSIEFSITTDNQGIVTISVLTKDNELLTADFDAQKFIRVAESCKWLV